MHMAPCLWASDPLAIAAGCCNAPIQACGQFQSHGRTPVLQPRQKACVIPGRLRAAHIFGDCDASCTQHGKATTIDARIRITKGTDNAADTGLDEGFCARGRLARMCAGLQCHINRGASRRVPCLGQRLRLCMWAAPGRCPSAPNNPIALNDHAAHSRVGPDVPLPAPAERQRKLHVAFVYIRRRKRRRHPSWFIPLKRMGDAVRSRSFRNHRWPGSFCKRLQIAHRRRCRSAPSFPSQSRR